MRLYTRLEHGHLPVQEIRRGYLLTRPDGVQEEYPNARRLLVALHGGRNPGMSFDRYFRRGRYNPMRERPQLDFGDLRRQAEAPRVPRGIDLGKRGTEVAKLLYKACGKSIQGYQYDFEDVLQDVYKGILVRNRGEGAWNPTKSSFGYYVTMVCRCVFANYHKREQRRRNREHLGGWAYQEGGWSMVDARDLALADPLDDLVYFLSGVRECMTDLALYITEQEDAYRQDTVLYQDARLAREVLPLVYAGKRRGEIATDLGIAAPAVGRALSYLRQVAESWVSSRILH